MPVRLLAHATELFGANAYPERLEVHEPGAGSPRRRPERVRGTVAAQDLADVEEHDRRRVVSLSRIGVTLSGELRLHLEQSTDAFVAHLPEANYFDV